MSWYRHKLERDLQRWQAAGWVSPGGAGASRRITDANAANAVNFLRYGIERYFVAQGKGPKLEALARDKKLAALIAIDGRGNAAIKGILIDGRLAYAEPLL